MTDYISNIDIGKTIYIPDGETWTTAVQNTNLGDNYWYALSYGNMKFVALSSVGYISVSTDGINWTQAEQDENLIGIVDIIYDGTKFISLNDSGYISTSENGLSWTSPVSTNLGSHWWVSIAYDGTKFIALSQTGYISYSTDAITWENVVRDTNLGSNNWVSIAYDGTKFVALGQTGYISTSTDGTNWTQTVQNIDLTNATWVSITYDGTKFVALDIYGKISTSTNGTNWTQAFYSSDLGYHSWQTLAHGGTKFVTLGQAGYISTSSDIATTQIPIGGDNFDGQWSTETFLILNSVTLSGNTRYTYSLDSYLPDDDYDYEILFFGGSTSTASSGKVCQLTLFSGTTTTDTMGYRLNRCQARTNATTRAGGVAIIPIYANDRNVTVFTQDSTTNNTDTYLKAVGYRRIGRNKSYKNLYCWTVDSTQNFSVYFTNPIPSIGDKALSSTGSTVFSNGDGEVCTGVVMSSSSDTAIRIRITFISGGEVATDFSRNSAGDIEYNYVSNLNSYPIGGNNFNGEVVMFTTDQSGLSVGTRNANEHNILFDTTIASESHATFSVANVIPNDGYDYELCFSVYTATPSTSGKVTNLQVVQGTHTTRPENAILVGYRVARTGATYADFKTAWLPISASDKNITFFNITTSTTTNYNCMIHGYRRIGTND